jgi:hypothetical protein
MENLKPTEKQRLIRFLVFGFLCMLALNIWSNTVRIKEKNDQINGVIEKIDYSVKGIPTVLVNGKSYTLGTGWRFNEKMNVGDSLVKEKGLMTYKLIKSRTEEVISSE